MVAEPAARRRRTERPAPAAPALRGVKGEPGPDVARGLDALLHHRLRLGMVSALAAVESLAFNDLKRLLQTSDGNLSVHARKLEDAGYVTCTKTFENRRPPHRLPVDRARSPGGGPLPRPHGGHHPRRPRHPGTLSRGGPFFAR